MREAKSHLQAFSQTLIVWMACLGLFIGRFYTPETSRVRMDNVLLSLVIFASALTLSNILVIVVREKIGKGPMNLPATTLTINLVRYTILIIGVLMIFSVLGIAVAPLLTALGVGSLAVALGLHETLSNFFAGIYILKSQIIQLGDYIRLESGHEGFVVDVGLRSIHLKTLSNTMIYIPTAKASQSILVNFSHPTPDFTTPLEMQVEIGTDPDKVEKIALETAEKVMDKMQLRADEPPATLRFHGFGDSGLQFTIYLRAKEMNARLLLVHEYLKELSKDFAQNNIALALPQRVVHLKSSTPG